MKGHIDLGKAEEEREEGVGWLVGCFFWRGGYGMLIFAGYLMAGWLFGVFGISTFVGDLTPNPFLWK